MRLADFLKDKFDLSPEVPLPAGARVDAKEKPLSEMIPYSVHYDDETVITKDDGLVQVIKLSGLYHESLTADQIGQFERQRNTLLRSIANSDRGIYVHLVRRKENSYPGGEGETWFARSFNQLWKARFEKESFFTNEIYLSIVQNRFRQAIPGLLDRVAALCAGKKVSQEELHSFAAQARTLYEVSNLVVQTLQPYV